MKYKKIVIAGGGVLGSQIAFQSAYCGYDVTIWLRSEQSILKAKKKIDNLKDTYLKELSLMKKGSYWCYGISTEDDFDKTKCKKKIEEAYNNIKYVTDMKEAFSGKDLVIECVAEVLKEKLAFYQKIKEYLAEKTVIVTNSSTLLPSAMASATGRAEKFLALHFANAIWKNNTAEVMAHDLTNKKYFNEIIDFANSINMIALPVLKEKSGYLLNSMLVPFLLSGLDLLVNNVSDVNSIDTAWKRGTGAPRGPFEIFDVVGLETAYNIVLQYQKVPGLLSPLLKKMLLPYNFKGMEALLKKYIDEGKLGKSSGEGFYKYSK